MEAAMGQDFRDVRVHTDRDAAHAARRLDALAFTTGRDVFFDTGRYRPDTREGQWLLAHELTHVVQQRNGGAAPARAVAPWISQPGDPTEREADAAADAVIAGQPVLQRFTAVPGGGAQRLGLPSVDDILNLPGQVLDAGEELVEGAAEVAGDVVDAAGEALSAAWDLATSIASAIAGAVSVSGTTVTITAGPLCTDLALAAELPVPGLSRFLPFFSGQLPISQMVTAYGEVGLNLSLDPLLRVQLGPGCLNSLVIRIDPLAGRYSLSSSVTFTVAAQAGAEARVGLRGAVGLIILWPDPPIPIPIEVAGVEAGLAGAFLVTGVDQVSSSVSTSLDLSALYAGGTFFSRSAAQLHDLGLALDLAYGGYGQLDVLGATLCRLYWPLGHWGAETTARFAFGYDLVLGANPFSFSLGAGAALMPGVNFADLPLALQRDLLTDECPALEALCTVLRLLGRLPRDLGIVWPGAPPGGPLPGPLPGRYARDPGLPSKAKCRGACGPDCDYCTPPKDEYACEVLPNGTHRVWKYPNHQLCGAHAGCKQHDQCYDWCGGGGPGGMGPFLCRRWCDLECLCDYRASQCVGWAFGRPPYDETLRFADPPVIVGGCWGRCPTAAVSKEGDVTGFTYCLDPVTLWDGISLSDGWAGTTKAYRLYQRTFIVPKVFIPVRLTVQAQGSASVDVGGTLGPITLENACLTMDPVTGTYRGGAELHIKALAFIRTVLEGRIIGTVDVPCLVTLLRAIGALGGEGTLEFPVDQKTAVTLTCRNGELILDAAAFIKVCAELKARLFARLQVIIAGFEVYSNQWTLAARKWGRCWEWQLGATQGRLPLPGRGGGGGGAAQPRIQTAALGGDADSGGGQGSNVGPLLLTQNAGGGGGGTALATPQVIKAGLDAKDTLNTFLNLATQLEKINGAGTGADLTDPVEDAINAVCPVPKPEDIACVKARPQDVTKITMTGTDRGVSTIAEPLVKKPDPANPPGDASNCTTGFPPSCLVGNRRWVKGHLLHGPTAAGRPHLNGPGVCRNIMMVDTSLNQNMRNDIEDMAIKRLQKNEVLFYEASATPFAATGDLSFIAKSVSAKFGCLDPVTGDKRQIHSNTYPNKHDPPDTCTA
jgi:hypothetical protein